MGRDVNVPTRACRAFIVRTPQPDWIEVTDAAATLLTAMVYESLSLDVPLGLLELDADGTVLYFKPDGRDAQAAHAEGIVGRNLFADVMHAGGCETLRTRLGDFWRGHDPTRSFDLTFNSERDTLAARVLFARTREQSDGRGRESVFVYIRRA